MTFKYRFRIGEEKSLFDFLYSSESRSKHLYSFQVNLTIHIILYSLRVYICIYIKNKMFSGIQVRLLLCY
jgi:hypothetical protein